jgi:predicted transcriptional regulator
MARPTTARVTAARKASGGTRGTQVRPAGEIVTATLATHPDRTAAELAQLAGLGTSTVSKALAALETAGRASRHTPEATGENGRRPAARWQPVPATAPADPEPPAAPRRPPTTKTTKAQTSTTPTVTTQATGGRSEPEATAGTAEDAHTGDGNAPPRVGRLGKGELGALVLEYLLAHPDTDLGPTAIGKALARSQGAVANCLTKLATSGDIARISDKPRRYRLAS